MASRVSATRMELTKTKKRLQTASRGHKLLKDKQDEMARRFMIYIRRNMQLRKEIESIISGAMADMSLAEAQMGSCALAEALYISGAAAETEFGKASVMSIEVPDIEIHEKNDSELSFGFAFSSEKLDNAVITMNSLVPKLYELAETEKICDMLADEMESTRRRVNALEYVMIPDMKASIKYISMKLEDNERGNLTRLMKVKEMMAAE